MDFEESETKKNLKTALQGEALAHLKYQFYKSKISELSKEYENIFNEILHNEKEHGKIWFKLLYGNEIPDNLTNLLDAIEGETYEYSIMYQEFGDIALEEGYEDIAKLFYGVAEIEKHHSETFTNMYNGLNVSNGLFASENYSTEWKCLNCGHIVINENAPTECPICKHPQKFFKKL